MKNGVYTPEEIRALLIPIAQKHALRAVYLFGSYARGEAGPQSDIDLLIDTGGRPLQGMFALGALYADLEEAFEIPVDMVTLTALNQRAHVPSDESFRDTVLKEKVPVYAVA